MSEQGRSKTTLARREFLELVGEGVMVLALSGFVYFLGQDKTYVRPPKARPEEIFQSLCLRCDKCADACPWGLISPVPITESLLNAGTPTLHGACRYCWLCVEACPTGALR